MPSSSNSAKGNFPLDKLPSQARDRIADNLPSPLQTLNGSTFFFSAYTEETGYELYRMAPGSNVPTVIDLNQGVESSDPRWFTVASNGDLFFSAFTEETGQELYKLAAGSATPALVADINQAIYSFGDGQSSSPEGFTFALNGDLFFSAYTEETGRELYRLAAGSNTPILIDIIRGSESSNPQHFMATEHGDIFFRAYSERNGLELYEITSGSTSPILIDINQGAGDSLPFFW